MTDQEIENLINSKLNQKKTQFGKAYSELGTSDSNLILRTKGDVKVQWGGKFIDLIKDGKVNASSELYIKKIDSIDTIGSTKGIYIVNDNEIYVGNSSNYTKITQDTSSALSFKDTQTLSQEEINIAQNNIGLTFENEDAVKNSNLSEGIVYLTSTKEPYIYKEETLVPILNISTSTNEESVKEFNELTVQELTATSASIEELKVSKLIIEEESSTVYDLKYWDNLIVGEIFSDTSIDGIQIYGKLTAISSNTIELENDNIKYTYQKIYYKETEDDECSESLLCIKYQDNNSTCTFDPTRTEATISNSYIDIPYVNFSNYTLLYEDLEGTIPIQYSTFEITGNINNSSIILKNCNYTGSLNLNNCELIGDLTLVVEDTTPEEILDILSNKYKKELYFENDSFHIKPSIPKSSIILCQNPEIPIDSITFNLTIPSLNVLNNKNEIIGSTQETQIQVSLAQILVNSTNYSWKLL